MQRLFLHIPDTATALKVYLNVSRHVREMGAAIPWALCVDSLSDVYS